MQMPARARKGREGAKQADQATGSVHTPDHHGATGKQAQDGQMIQLPEQLPDFNTQKKLLLNVGN